MNFSLNFEICLPSEITLEVCKPLTTVILCISEHIYKEQRFVVKQFSSKLQPFNRYIAIAELSVRSSIREPDFKYHQQLYLQSLVVGPSEAKLEHTKITTNCPFDKKDTKIIQITKRAKTIIFFFIFQ